MKILLWLLLLISGLGGTDVAQPVGRSADDVEVRG